MNRGFSLVELSVVLVMIGLLAGGIMAGQSLIRAAELRSVMTQISTVRSAVFNFREKYAGLPGDLPNAVKIWGAQAGGTADGTDATCAALTAAATTPATCNGDGDLTIGVTSDEIYEAYRFWQHLANAGMVDGSYTGVVYSGVVTAYSSAAGVNVFKTKYANGGFTARYYPEIIDSADANYYVGAYGNMMWFGADSPGASYTSNPLITPADAYNIDAKLDDTKPGYGTIMALKSQSACVSSTDSMIATYAVTTNANACSLMVMFTF